MSVDAFAALVELVREHFEVKTQSEVANILDLHQPQVANWLRNPAPTRKKWKRVYSRLIDEAVKDLLWTIVEFQEIRPAKSGTGWTIHSDRSIRNAMRSKLDHQMGLYVFYDSAGRLLYVGKTSSNLWYEIHQRLNATVNRPIYMPSRRKGVRMGELAHHMSAFGVGVKAAIHSLEVLLLRTSPNDHANTNLGRFTQASR